jgi:hypothetical protein
LIKYKFNCACGCGQQSDELGKDYIRLKTTQKWVAKGCEAKDKIIKPFKNGFIVEKGDF